ncbi:hypothetical protein [Thalassomonas actiniarum]|uniref:Uncharacterized protein n=1 Tax=Thalassomonas actiniarum TaxID=485447 RepID=A0AAF0C323_9GAMM|nr:hypothetical protein [Thalassomonas actiniarum]WDE00747.1 hypothetical protein SG35_009000 [Thalassomonas actiniarum]
MSETWFLLCGGALFFLWGIAVFCFSRITVRHIEDNMAKKGELPPEWDKGIGIRLIMYAMVIVAKKAEKVSLVNDQLILSYARRKDWYLALFFLVSFAAFLAVISVGYFLYGPG